MRVFGIDPGSVRTGYGCVESDGRRHRVLACGALTMPARAPLPDKLVAIHAGLAELLVRTRPDCVVVENVFHAANARSALVLGHARGVAILSARELGLPVVEYTPAEVKRAVVGYGRADKTQVAFMVARHLALPGDGEAGDAADALAVALCEAQQSLSLVKAR